MRGVAELRAIIPSHNVGLIRVHQVHESQCVELIEPIDEQRMERRTGIARLPLADEALTVVVRHPKTNVADRIDRVGARDLHREVHPERHVDECVVPTIRHRAGLGDERHIEVAVAGPLGTIDARWLTRFVGKEDRRRDLLIDGAVRMLPLRQRRHPTILIDGQCRTFTRKELPSASASCDVLCPRAPRPRSLERITEDHARIPVGQTGRIHADTSLLRRFWIRIAALSEEAQQLIVGRGEQVDSREFRRNLRSIEAGVIKTGSEVGIERLKRSWVGDLPRRDDAAVMHDRREIVRLLPIRVGHHSDLQRLRHIGPRVASMHGPVRFAIEPMQHDHRRADARDPQFDFVRSQPQRGEFQIRRAVASGLYFKAVTICTGRITHRHEDVVLTDVADIAMTARHPIGGSVRDRSRRANHQTAERELPVARHVIGI